MISHVGIIGTGTVAQMMHLPLLSEMPDKFQIAAVSDVSPTQLAYIAGKYNAKAIADPYEMIQSDAVDTVFICSPDAYHAEYALAAINAGKNVFIEKPVTLDIEDLDKLIEAHKAHPESICMVGYMRRFSDGFFKCEELLKASDKKIEYMRFRDIILEGDFFMGQTFLPYLCSDIDPEVIKTGNAKKMTQLKKALGENCSEQQRRTYTMLTGLGVHTLSAVRELVGTPENIESVSVQGDHVIIVFRYHDFLAVYEILNDQDVVQFDAAIEIYQHDRRMKIKYETPYLRYQPATFEVINSTKTSSETTVYGPDYHDPFKNELEYFHDCIEKHEEPKRDLEDARADLELCHNICMKITE